MDFAGSADPPIPRLTSLAGVQKELSSENPDVVVSTGPITISSAKRRSSTVFDLRKEGPIAKRLRCASFGCWALPWARDAGEGVADGSEEERRLKAYGVEVASRRNHEAHRVKDSTLNASVFKSCTDIF